jgi:Domain of unknown function (DUF4845)
VKLSRWRLAAGIAVLAVLAFLGAELFPIYLHNLQLEQFVEEVTHRREAATASDDLLRARVLDKAAQLGLPVRPDNVRIERAPERVRIDVRYEMRVDLPLYTVNLHFYPGAGSR